MVVAMLLLVLCVVGGVGVDAFPIVGTSPAKAETDRAQVRISAIPSRFMDLLLFLRITRNLASVDTRELASANKQYGKIPCKVMAYRTTIPLAVHTFSSRRPLERL
jgi:hypothetical protein